MRREYIFVLATAVLLFGPVPSSFGTVPSFQGLGGTSSRAWGVSGDGLVVVGESSGHAYKWWGGTSSDLGDGPAYAASYDGSVIVGYEFFWTSGSGREAIAGTALGVSDDGLVVTGFIGIEAYRWDDGTPTSMPGGYSYSHSHGVSGDGRIAVGTHINTDGDYEAFGWTKDDIDVVGLGFLSEIYTARSLSE